MDVQLPDGRVIAGVPDGTTKSQLMSRLAKYDGGSQPQKPEELTLGGSLKSAVTDALPEAGRTFASQVKAASNDLPNKNDLNPENIPAWYDLGAAAKGVMKTGKGLVEAAAAIPSLGLGAADSLLGHPLAYAYQQADKINQNNTPGEGFTPAQGQSYYDVAKRDVNTALAAMPSNRTRLGVEPPPRTGTILTKAQEAAQSLTRDAMQADQITPNSMATRISNANRTNVPSVALDVAERNINNVPMRGQNIQGLVDAASKTPGADLTVTAQTAARSAAQHDRISGHLDNLLGKEGYYSIADDVVKNIEEQANPAREKALSYPKNISSPIINDMLSRPAGLRAIPIAATKAAEAGEPLGNVDALGRLKNFNTRTLHWIKMAYDDLINSQEGKNQITGKMTEVGRQWTINKNKINDVIKSQNPDYANWMQKYGDEAARKRALDNGRDFLKKDPEEVFREFGKASDPEKQAYMTGVKRAIQDKITNSADSTDAVNKVWNEGTRQRLKAITSPQQFREFNKIMNLERRAAAIDKKNMRSASIAPENLTQESKLAGMAKKIFSPKSAVIDATFNAMAKSLQKRVSKMNADTATEVLKIWYSNEPGKFLKLKTVAKQNGLSTKDVMQAVTRIVLKPALLQKSSLSLNPDALFGQGIVPANANDTQDQP